MQQASQSYFHPSMLEDPWARLERQRGNASFASSIGDAGNAGNAAGEKAEKQLSDSMIPQASSSLSTTPRASIATLPHTSE